MRVAIIGSRSIEERRIQKEVYELICSYVPANCTEIISGGASGADKLAELYAEESKLHLTVFRPDYESFGKRAPIIRNCEIIDHSQYVIALWDGRSRGTAFTVTECIKKGIPVRVFVL